MIVQAIKNGVPTTGNSLVRGTRPGRPSFG